LKFKDSIRHFSDNEVGEEIKNWNFKRFLEIVAEKEED